MIAQYIYHIRTQEQDQDETEESDGHRIDEDADLPTKCRVWAGNW